MAVEIRVPTLGESVVEATVGRWHKKVGDPVAPDEVVVELETDKVNVDVSAPSAGVLQRIDFIEGETVGVNTVLAILGANESVSAPVAATSNGTQSAASAAPVTAMSEPSPSESVPRTVATPVAEKMAADSGLDLSRIRGTGANGKVTIEDVRSAISAKQAEPVPAAAVAEVPSAATLPVITPVAIQKSTLTTPYRAIGTEAVPAGLPGLTAALNRREEREPMSKLRQTIAERLTEVLHTAAMLTTFNEVDMSAIMEVRKRRRDAFKERHGVGLGFMSFFTKAVVGALKAFPYLNAEIQGKEIVKKFYYDIGIAVGTDRGLMVPVLRDADRKSFPEIEKEIISLAGKARDNKLSIAEMLGGTFTVTNGGVYGSLMSTPILNPPQVGILGMHKIQERPVAVNGEVAIRPMMYLALSYDHRIVDGGEAVRFLVRIKELLEDPETLLLEG